MSIFTSRVTDTVTIPEGTFTIRKLAPRHLEAARKEQQRKAIAEMKALGSELVKELRGLTSDQKKSADESKDVFATYDRHTVLVKGIQAWSFDFELSEGAIEDLDDDTQALVATAIVKLSKPSLFAEAEVAQKNG